MGRCGGIAAMAESRWTLGSIAGMGGRADPTPHPLPCEERGEAEAERGGERPACGCGRERLREGTATQSNHATACHRFLRGATPSMPQHAAANIWARGRAGWLGGAPQLHCGGNPARQGLSEKRPCRGMPQRIAIVVPNLSRMAATRRDPLGAALRRDSAARRAADGPHKHRACRNIPQISGKRHKQPRRGMPRAWRGDAIGGGCQDAGGYGWRWRTCGVLQATVRR
jgi:hypothetical protein